LDDISFLKKLTKVSSVDIVFCIDYTLAQRSVVMFLSFPFPLVTFCLNIKNNLFMCFFIRALLFFFYQDFVCVCVLYAAAAVNFFPTCFFRQRSPPEF